jgi:DNA primase
VTGLLDLDAIRREHTLPSVVGAVIKLQRAGREWKACCPFHSDRSPSFTIFDDGHRAKCFGCGWTGDVLDFVQKAHSVTLPEAARMLGAGSLPTLALPPEPALSGKDDRTAEAITIWRGAVAATGTPVETYLNTRGLKLPIPASIRTTRLPYGKIGPLHPVMVALVASVDHHALGIQRTYLNAAGTGKAAVPKAKLSLGSIRGGAVRLAPAAPELIVCEGLEDGLTLQQQTGLPVWVGVGTSGMMSMQLPKTVQRIIIGADADDAGENAARQAADRFAREGRDVRIMRPSQPHKDFNAELMSGGTA